MVHAEFRLPTPGMPGAEGEQSRGGEKCQCWPRWAVVRLEGRAVGSGPVLPPEQFPVHPLLGQGAGVFADVVRH